VAVALAALTLLHWITPWMLLLLTLALSMETRSKLRHGARSCLKLCPEKTCCRPLRSTALSSFGARDWACFWEDSDCGGRRGHGLYVECAVVSWRVMGNCAMEAAGTADRHASGDTERRNSRGNSVHAKRARHVDNSRPNRVDHVFRKCVLGAAPNGGARTAGQLDALWIAPDRFGGGAVLGAMVLQRARSFLSSDAMLTVGTTVLQGALWAHRYVPKPIVLLCVAIAFGGAAWTAVMSLMSTLMTEPCARLGARSSIRGLHAGVYGCVGGGSAFWGYVAGHHGTHFSLVAAAIGTAASPGPILLSRLPDAAVDLKAWDHWGKPMLVGEVEPDQGPVLVTVEYEIETKHADEFIAALEKFSSVRRRDGASHWGVYYDTEHPTRYLETLVVDSWAEHLRQHTRLTQGDREVEERVHRFEAKPLKRGISSMPGGRATGRLVPQQDLCLLRCGSFGKSVFRSRTLRQERGRRCTTSTSMADRYRFYRRLHMFSF